VAAHLFHARQLAARELKRRYKKVQANRGMEQSPPLSFPAGREDHYHLQHEKNAQTTYS